MPLDILEVRTGDATGSIYQLEYQMEGRNLKHSLPVHLCAVHPRCDA